MSSNLFFVFPRPPCLCLPREGTSRASLLQLPAQLVGFCFSASAVVLFPPPSVLALMLIRHFPRRSHHTAVPFLFSCLRNPTVQCVLLVLEISHGAARCCPVQCGAVRCRAVFVCVCVCVCVFFGFENPMVRRTAVRFVSNQSS